MTRRLPVLLAATVLLAAACGDDTVSVSDGPDGGPSSTTTSTTTVPPIDPETPEGRLAAARARWAESGPDSYRLTIRELCFCPETIWIDTVVDGAVTSHEPGSDDSLHDPGARTMDDLFDEVSSAIDTGYVTLELEFDPDTGALERYWVDVNEMIADEEHGVEVDVGPAPVAPADIDSTTLTDAYPCGYLFAAGDADQTLGLVVAWDGGGPPDLASPVSFPSDEWSGELQIGTDLFANWCDDVIEADEPVPVVVERWQVAAGELTIEGPDFDPATECGEVRAALSGAVVESPEGETSDLGDLALVNLSFGCFAG